ncbi:MAG TPA: DUF4148 domain-containing protein [Paraburkholderia sp.]
MKSIVQAAVLAALVAVPAISFAQAQQQPLTRAQVREQIVQLRAVGYDPRDWADYPENIQAAQARLSAEQAANTAYGPATTGTTQSGQ